MTKTTHRELRCHLSRVLNLNVDEAIALKCFKVVSISINNPPAGTAWSERIHVNTLGRTCKRQHRASKQAPTYVTDADTNTDIWIHTHRHMHIDYSWPNTCNSCQAQNLMELTLSRHRWCHWHQSERWPMCSGSHCIGTVGWLSHCWPQWRGGSHQSCTAWSGLACPLDAGPIHIVQVCMYVCVCMCVCVCVRMCVQCSDGWSTTMWSMLCITTCILTISP